MSSQHVWTIRDRASSFREARFVRARRASKVGRRSFDGLESLGLWGAIKKWSGAIAAMAGRFLLKRRAGSREMRVRANA